MQHFPILDLLQDSHDPPLTPQDIEELEILLGVRLPQEYTDFLLQFNGGNFCRHVTFDIPNPTKYVTGGTMLCFYGEPNDGIDKHGIVWHAKMQSDRIPLEYLPIAIAISLC